MVFFHPSDVDLFFFSGCVEPVCLPNSPVESFTNYTAISSGFGRKTWMLSKTLDHYSGSILTEEMCLLHENMQVSALRSEQNLKCHFVERETSQRTFLHWQFENDQRKGKFASWPDHLLRWLFWLAAGCQQRWLCNDSWNFVLGRTVRQIQKGIGYKSFLLSVTDRSTFHFGSWVRTAGRPLTF